jgi:hypothetical protein
MSDISRDEFNDRMDLLMAAIGGVNARLDVLNGRTRLGEMAITEIRTQMAEREKAQGRDQAARVTGAGAFLTAAITAIWQWVTR